MTHYIAANDTVHLSLHCLRLTAKWCQKGIGQACIPLPEDERAAAVGLPLAERGLVGEPAF